VADTSDLQPEVMVALRTGKLPAGAERSATEPDERRDSYSDDEQRFQMLYRQMVEERIAEWLDDNPYSGSGLLLAERQRIEDYCRDYVQRQWTAQLNKLGNAD
jgi:hypothetical protein